MFSQCANVSLKGLKHNTLLLIINDIYDSDIWYLCTSMFQVTLVLIRSNPFRMCVVKDIFCFVQEFTRKYNSNRQTNPNGGVKSSVSVVKSSTKKVCE